MAKRGPILPSVKSTPRGSSTTTDFLMTRDASGISEVMTISPQFAMITI